MLPLLVVATALAASPPPGTATDSARYYFTLFAGQSVPFRPRTAHTWATWTKVTDTPAGLVVEPVTISWLPVNGRVRPFWPFAVPGRNFSLDETYALMARYNARVSRWGPYEVTALQYEMARQQAAFLESGAVRYRVFDSFNTNRYVINCVHAVTHASPYIGNRIQPVIRVGEPGTSRLAAIYLRRGALIGYPVREDWVHVLSGGDRYPTVPREPGEYIPRFGSK